MTKAWDEGNTIPETVSEIRVVDIVGLDKRADGE